MVRTQVQFDETQHRRLRRWTRQLGISVAEGVRRCVAAELERAGDLPGREDRVRQAVALCGKYRDPQGASRVAVQHDRHLADAYRS